MATRPAPEVDIVLPVRDEERQLCETVERLRAYTRSSLPYRTRITIAENGSADHTWRLAAALAARHGDVVARHLDAAGRGDALREAWLGSDAAVLAYMDVDLSTDLRALLPLVAPLLSGHSDLAIGTRLARGAHVQRGVKRELISRAYNALLHGTFALRCSDAQCGFKAVRADAARALLPLVRDDGWFFDTELLILAEHAGLRIHEVPVDWIDDPDSRVAIVPTALADLRGLLRMRRELPDALRTLRGDQGRRQTVTAKSVPVVQGRRSHVANRCSTTSPAAAASASKAVTG